MNVDITHHDTFTNVAVSGHLDSSNVKDFEQPVLKEIERGNIYLLFDFRECTFMSSAGIRVILICAKKVTQAAGEMVITGLNDYIDKVFTISGLPSILTIIPNHDEAIQHIQSAAAS